VQTTTAILNGWEGRLVSLATSAHGLPSVCRLLTPHRYAAVVKSLNANQTYDASHVNSRTEQCKLHPTDRHYIYISNAIYSLSTLHYNGQQTDWACKAGLEAELSPSGVQGPLSGGQAVWSRKLFGSCIFIGVDKLTTFARACSSEFMQIVNVFVHIPTRLR